MGHHESMGKMVFCSVPVVALTVALIGCSGEPSTVTKIIDRSLIPKAAPTTIEKTTEARPIPTDAQVKEAFEAFINERADSGAMLAQSVTSVMVSDGVVTVTLDPDPVILELSPFDNHAELFGVPVAFNDDEGVWLR